MLLLVGAALLLAQVRLASLLPDPSSFGGKASGRAVLYSSDLYKYLDGGAEVYHNAGFVSLVHRTYKVGDIDLTVDIYDMGEAGRALAMYSRERPPDATGPKIGRASYSGDGFLNFVQSRYYVKLIAFSDRGKTEAALAAAARNISGKIHD